MLFRLLAGAVLLSIVNLASGAVITNSDPAALKSAIAEGGSVTLAFDGAVKMTEALNVVKDTKVDATGHSVMLDGSSNTRHFVSTNGARLRLINLILANGHFAGSNGQSNAPPGLPGQGGSIFNNGSLELVSCVFSNNSVKGGDAKVYWGAGGAAYGGAVWTSNGSLSANECIFTGNTSIGGNGMTGSDNAGGAGGNSYGGAVYATNSRISLDAVAFTNNVAQGGERSSGKVGGGGGSGKGGALAVEAGILSNAIVRSVFASNQTRSGTKSTSTDGLTAAYGGALYWGNGSILIEGSLFTNNLALGGPGWDHTGYPTFADGNAGAVYVGAGELEIYNSAMLANQSEGGSVPLVWSGGYLGQAWGGQGYGGAINNRGVLTLMNCTLSRNIAKGGDAARGFPGAGYGGAILNSGKVSLLNVTVSGNFTPPVPGVRGSSLCLLEGGISLTNTILSSADGETNVWGTITDGGHNLCSDGSANFTSASSKNNIDPLLGPLANNGGLTPTMALAPNSPALDAGDPVASPPTDQRGVARPMGSGPDIGAFELAPTATVTPLPGGTVRLDYSFQAGKSYGISGGTNLVDWLLLATRISDSSGSFQWEDPDSARLPLRFYLVQPSGTSSGTEPQR